MCHWPSAHSVWMIVLASLPGTSPECWGWGSGWVTWVRDCKNAHGTCLFSLLGIVLLVCSKVSHGKSSPCLVGNQGDLEKKLLTCVLAECLITSYIKRKAELILQMFFHAELLLLPVMSIGEISFWWFRAALFCLGRSICLLLFFKTRFCLLQYLSLSVSIYH